MIRSGLRMTREALPLVLVAGVFEVAGFALFAFGSRHGIAVAAVLSSQFAAIAAIAAYMLFRERLSPVQLAGVGGDRHRALRSSAASRPELSLRRPGHRIPSSGRAPRRLRGSRPRACDRWPSRAS